MLDIKLDKVLICMVDLTAEYNENGRLMLNSG